MLNVFKKEKGKKKMLIILKFLLAFFLMISPLWCIGVLYLAACLSYTDSDPQ